MIGRAIGRPGGRLSTPGATAPSPLSVDASGSLLGLHGEEEKQHFLDACAAGNPLGRIGTPEDTAQAVLFLLTSEYVNGIVLDVVGGETVDFMH